MHNCYKQYLTSCDILTYRASMSEPSLSDEWLLCAHKLCIRLYIYPDSETDCLCIGVLIIIMIIKHARAVASCILTCMHGK